jgi:hypothetical protein
MDSSQYNDNRTYLTWTLTMEKEDGNIDVENMKFSSYVALPNPIIVMPNGQMDFIYDFSIRDKNNYYDRENSSSIWEIFSLENSNNTNNNNNNNNSFILDLSTQQDNHHDSNINSSFILKISTSMDSDDEKDTFYDCAVEPSTPISISSGNIDGMGHTTASEPKTKHKVSLLILRKRDTNEEFPIRALFDSKIKFTFNIDDELRRENSHLILIYRLDLDVQCNESGEQRVFYENKWKRIHTYQLYISRSGYITSTHYNDNQMRTLRDPLNGTLNFILDANFSDGQFFSAGGKAFK